MDQRQRQQQSLPDNKYMGKGVKKGDDDGKGCDVKKTKDEKEKDAS